MGRGQAGSAPRESARSGEANLAPPETLSREHEQPEPQVSETLRLAPQPLKRDLPERQVGGGRGSARPRWDRQPVQQRDQPEQGERHGTRQIHSLQPPLIQLSRTFPSTDAGTGCRSNGTPAAWNAASW